MQTNQMQTNTDGWTINTSTSGSRQPSAKKPKESFIAAGCRLNGALELEGRATVDGEVRGEIISRGELTIGETASVDAAVIGDTVRIFGKVVGDIKATDILELHGGASVKGNIFCPRIVMHDGVFFEGFCTMQQVHLENNTEEELDVEEKVVNITSPLEESENN